MPDIMVLLHHPTLHLKTAKEQSYFSDVGRTEDGPAPSCPVCGRFTGMLSRVPPVRVDIDEGEQGLGDLAFGAGSEFLVSHRLLTLLYDHNITGIDYIGRAEVRRVRRGSKKTRDRPLFHCVRARTARAAVDTYASEFLYARQDAGFPHCIECRQVLVPPELSRGPKFLGWERIVLQPGTYAGEDVFTPRGLSVRLVSSRFVELCQKYSIEWPVFLPAEQYRYYFLKEDDPYGRGGSGGWRS